MQFAEWYCFFRIALISIDMTCYFILDSKEGKRVEQARCDQIYSNDTPPALPINLISPHEINLRASKTSARGFSECVFFASINSNVAVTLPSSRAN